MGKAPKPSAAMEQAAMMSAQTGQDMLAWMKSQAEITNQWASEDRARYKSTFEPLQDQFIKEAQEFASPERRQAEADRAGADVSLAVDQRMAADNRRLAAMGIDPRSGRARDLNRQGATDAGLAVAGARNMARRTVDDQGRSLRASAVNMGAGMGVNPATAMGLSNQAGGAGFSGAMQGYGQQGNILQADFNNRMQAHNSRMGAIGGIAGAIGMGAGLYFGGPRAALGAIR